MTPSNLSESRPAVDAILNQLEACMTGLVAGTLRTSRSAGGRYRYWWLGEDGEQLEGTPHFWLDSSKVESDALLLTLNGPHELIEEILEPANQADPALASLSERGTWPALDVRIGYQADRIDEAAQQIASLLNAVHQLHGDGTLKAA
jgi:hypothetical protein